LGDYGAAIAMGREVWDLSKKVLGDTHPDTLTALNNLAATLSESGEHEEAVEMERQVFAITKRVLGDEHPRTLDSSNNLVGGWLPIDGCLLQQFRCVTSSAATSLISLSLCVT
jgi:hypothetical protein